MVTYLGYSLPHVLNSHARKQDSRVLYLNVVIKKCNPDMSTPLCVVCVDNSIDYCFPQDGQRNAPDVPAPEFGKIRSAHGVLFEKLHCPFNCYRQVLVDLSLIENISLVLTDEPPALYPGLDKYRSL